jgi:hypothetical protein
VKRVEGADGHDGPSRIAARATEQLAAPRLVGGVRPGGVRPDLHAQAEVTQDRARRLVPRQHQRVGAAARHERRQGRLHRARLAAHADRELALHARAPQRARHEHGQRIGEGALEHGALARDHAVVAANLRAQGHGERGPLEGHLARAAEVPAGALGLEGRDADLDVLVAEEVAELADDLLDAHVGARVARAVVSDEQQAQRLARRPAHGAAEGVSRGLGLDRDVHEAHEQPIAVEDVVGERRPRAAQERLQPHAASASGGPTRLNAGGGPLASSSWMRPPSASGKHQAHSPGYWTSIQ